ncbi:AraC family transcriptional regulator ligand-binding domain-containing protein [Actinoplanes sp. NEAU-A12]|uniref:AraC family transcriptional regulator ligand-binding domain-containing protein n=1 Tax=Actinoplanes sandaracinus TaxID=3045177 RepID=A0ABT6WIB9_9ACTN|nr:AraC family transcriptional regulator [Actinoplanes sandaracinus]MDI6099469.1 AraC family transcriptional regulator ligand-binding domain-containing protein [Actinoplanes sandaracinus]
MPLIRSAGLRGFRATVAELGGDAEAYAHAAGLPAAALDADDMLVNDDALARTLEVAAHCLSCPDLGLRVAVRQDLGTLGPLALAIQHSPTAGDALERTSRYLFVHAEAHSLTLEADPYGQPGTVALRYDIGRGRPAPVQGTDLCLGFLHRAIITLIGPYDLRSVELPYRPRAPLTAYQDFFGAPVRIERPSVMLRMPAGLLRHPLDRGDPQLSHLALAFLAEQAARTGPGITQQVHAALVQTLGTAPAEIGAIAALLNLHPRTLQRRLRAHGTTFAAVLDDVRRAAAHRYLTGTDTPLGQVAGLLGLSEQSALTRCCRRWFGATPTAIRRASGST